MGPNGASDETPSTEAVSALGPRDWNHFNKVWGLGNVSLGIYCLPKRMLYPECKSSFTISRKGRKRMLGTLLHT